MPYRYKNNSKYVEARKGITETDSITREGFTLSSDFTAKTITSNNESATYKYMDVRQWVTLCTEIKSIEKTIVAGTLNCAI